MTATTHSNIGRTVEYTGDACNAPRTGYVADEFSDRWGSHVVIAWDDMGEREGFAPTTTLRRQLIDEQRKPGGRFYYA